MDLMEIVLLGAVLILSIYYFFLQTQPNVPTSKKKQQLSFSNKKPQPVKPKKKSIIEFLQSNQDQNNKFLIVFFGSQTGTAEDLATRLGKQVHSDMAVSTLICDPEEYDMTELSHCHNMFPDKTILFGFFMATYGEGEPTDNAVEFYNWIMHGKGKIADEGDQEEDSDPLWSQRALEGLSYFVFALGNKTYEHFNAIGRRLDKRLVKCGAQKAIERGEGDDDGNMEDDFLKWKETAIKKIANFYGITDALDAARRHRLSPHVPEFTLTYLNDAPSEKVFSGELGQMKSPRVWQATGKVFPSGVPEFRDISNAISSFDLKHPYYAPIDSAYPLFNQSLDYFDASSSSFASASSYPNGLKPPYQLAGNQVQVERQCYHIEFDLTGSGIHYQTGDHLGIWPSNDPDDVLRLASLMNLSSSPNTFVDLTTSKGKASFPTPCSIETILTHYVDLNTIMKQHHLEILAKYSQDEQQKQRLFHLVDQRELYIELVENGQKTLADILEDFNSIKVPFEVAVTEILSKISHRYYSISSSSERDPEKVSITAVVVRYALQVPDANNPNLHKKLVLKQGLTTSWLQRLTWNRPHLLSSLVSASSNVHNNKNGNAIPPLYVPCYIRSSTFRLPSDPRVPIVMVGPGTGLAPFRGFVQERFHLASRQGVACGSTWLFFGCRHPEKDFLYRKELEDIATQSVQIGFNFRLITAFSRLEGQPKVYVQHRLKEYRQQIWQVLYGDQGHFYICGDAKNMAKDVNQELVSMAIECGRLSESQAQDWIKQMKSQSRYQEDVWA